MLGALAKQTNKKEKKIRLIITRPDKLLVFLEKTTHFLNRADNGILSVNYRSIRLHANCTVCLFWKRISTVTLNASLVVQQRAEPFPANWWIFLVAECHYCSMQNVFVKDCKGRIKVLTRQILQVTSKIVIAAKLHSNNVQQLQHCG